MKEMKGKDLLAGIDKLLAQDTWMEDVINAIPASVYINQIDTIDDMTTGKNVWSNKFALDYVGYTREEIDSMGFAYIEAIMHPDDMKMARDSIRYLLEAAPGQVFQSVSRVRHKDGNYRWQYGNTRVFKRKPDGTPWQFINITVDMTDPPLTEKKLADALLDIDMLVNKGALGVLSRRECQILQLIAQGKTDKEIGGMLHISKGTVHTCRNKMIKKTNTINTATLAVFSARCGLY